MKLNSKQETDIVKIGKDVAKKSFMKDKEEALSVALLGIARGLKTYNRKKDVKWTTYLYRCAQLEVWAEWRKQNRKKRGSGYITESLEDLIERGIDI